MGFPTVRDTHQYTQILQMILTGALLNGSMQKTEQPKNYKGWLIFLLPLSEAVARRRTPLVHQCHMDSSTVIAWRKPGEHRMNSILNALLHCIRKGSLEVTGILRWLSCWGESLPRCTSYWIVGSQSLHIMIYITLHYIKLHYIRLHYTTLH